MLKIESVSRRFGDFSLSGINLEIREGEYYVLLGRSGSGKTQLLELIAGLNKPDTGKIFLDNEDITFRKIQDRRIGIVFQDYAIFPHLSVEQNIGYPLKMRNLSRDIIKKKVDEAAEQMNIRHLLSRSVVNLSGGEKQRIALARTLVTTPRLLLLDEPLSSLDASLRDDMKRLLRKLNRDGHTIIHVTHDYADAVSLAQRVGVIHNGRIIQEGQVTEVFRNPVNRFVARYAGYKNFFRLKPADKKENKKAISKGNLEFLLDIVPPDGEFLAVVRNDALKISKSIPQNEKLNRMRAVIIESIPAENGIEIEADAGERFFITVQNEEYNGMQLKCGDDIWISFPPSAVCIISGHPEHN